MQANPEGAVQGENRELFYMRGDEYSLREISFQREQVGLPGVWAAPHSHGRAIFGSPQTVMPQEGGIFTMLVMEEHELYYINEYIPGGEVMVNFSSIWEPASLGQRISIFSLYIP